MENLLKVSYESKIILNKKKLSVAILNNGTRIITEEAIFKAFNKSRRGRVKKEVDDKKMLPFIDIHNYQEFIDEDLEKMLKTINYYTIDKELIKGYNAEILPKLCKVYLAAEKQKKLPTQQLSLAKVSEDLLAELLEREIKDLIDNSVSYKYDKENKEVLKIFKKHLGKDFYIWQKIFPIVFFKELFRLNGWSFIIAEIKIRPSIISTWINKLIFEELPDKTIEELQSSKPKIGYIKPFDFFLTNDIGNPLLKTQINKVITLFLLSNNMEQMWSQFNILKLKQGKQIDMPYNFNEKGYTIEPIEEVSLSDFNKMLKIAVNYNPKKNQ
ncbi:P63C domain-containing protein [Tenacibaculum adriaticum]|uniref:P63C domain-containing protein n=1 Tax=Tenacibaculum adriaticum TaxID=413713 RepID=A0A5S5DYM8_9FLAO|nr:P63C domain-containing protein [Tenacibaculum adriaticum]TYQ00349.1 P63C domain-containing protein [Tenacibaculum adriaticum]